MLRLLLGLAASLPIGVALRVGATLGRLAFRLLRSQRSLALDHLALAFPDKTASERWALAEACFAELGRCGLEACAAGKIQPRLRDYVRWPDEEIESLRMDLAGGGGGIFVTGHLGNWELLARRIAAEGFDHAVVVRDSGDPRLSDLVRRFRSAGGVRTVGRGQGLAPVREMLSAFRRGALIAFLIDQDTRVQGVQVPFFGRLAHTPTVAEDLARRTGAPVFVGFVHRHPDGGHRMHTERVPWDASMPPLTALLTRRIEEEIRSHPTDWVWMHRRWKRGAVQPTENTVLSSA